MCTLCGMRPLFCALLLTAAPGLFAAEDPSPQHVQMMKEIGSLQGKIRKNEDVEASAKRLAALSNDVQAFWGKRSEVGLKASKDMNSAAMAIAGAAAAGKADDIAAGGKSLGGACRSCHDAHREKVSEGVYRIK